MGAVSDGQFKNVLTVELHFNGESKKSRIIYRRASENVGSQCDNETFVRRLRIGANQIQVF